MATERQFSSKFLHILCQLCSGLSFHGCLYSKQLWKIETVSSSGAEGRSISLTPRPQDHGTNLTCRVTFPRAGVSTEGTLTLSVSCECFLRAEGKGWEGAERWCPRGQAWGPRQEGHRLPSDSLSISVPPGVRRGRAEGLALTPSVTVSLS